MIKSGHIPETIQEDIATWAPLESARYVRIGLLKAINRPYNLVVGHVLTFNLGIKVRTLWLKNERQS